MNENLLQTIMQALQGAANVAGQPAPQNALNMIPNQTLRDLVQRVQQNTADTLGGKFLLPVVGQVQNPLHNVPVLGGAMDVAATGLPNLLGLGLTELSPNIGKALSGGLLGGAGMAMGAPAQTPILGPAAQALKNTPGDPYARLRAANEAAASGNGIPVGVLNLLLDPTNYIGLGETVGAGAKAEKVAATFARTAPAASGVSDLIAKLGGEASMALPDAADLAARLNVAEGAKRWVVRQGQDGTATLADSFSPAPGIAQTTDMVNPRSTIVPAQGLDNLQQNAVSFLGLLRHAAQQGFQAELDALHRPAGKLNPHVLGNLWSQQVVTTVKNFLQDIMTNHLWLARQGVDSGTVGAFQRDLTSQVINTAQKPTELLPSSLNRVVQTIGIDNPEFMKALDDNGIKGAAPYADAKLSPGILLGQSFHSHYSKAVEGVNAFQSMLANALFASTSGLGTAANAAIPGLGLAYGGLKGLLMPAADKMFEILNGVTHMTYRSVVADDEARTALAQAAPKLIDVVKHLGGDVSGLAADGTFSAADVLNALGVDTTKLTDPQELAAQIASHPAAKAWQEALLQAGTLGFDRSKQIFADFSKQNTIDKVTGGVIPFTSWASRAMSRTIAQLAENPAVALTLTHALQADAAWMRNQGLPGYIMGAIPFTDQTPLVGALVRAVNGGAPGTLYVNPTATLSPINASLVGADVQHQQGLPPGNITTLDTGTRYPPTLYQKAVEPLDAMGYQFSPAIQALAYALGWDFQRPGSLDRYAGIEAGMPGPMSIPDIYHRLLGAAREKITGSSDTYDPVANRLAEDVLKATGQPISFPANRLLAMASASVDSPLYKQALREVQNAGLVRGIVSVVNPTQTEATTAVKQAQLKAMASMYTPDEILAAAAKDPALADQMIKYNADLRTGASNPAAATYTRPQVPAIALEDPRMIAWEQAHAMLGMISPQEYQAQRNAYALSLGFNSRQQPIASVLPGPSVAQHFAAP